MKSQAEELKAALQRDGFVLNGEKFAAEIHKEARRALLPKFVANLISKTLHRPCQSMVVTSDPKTWATKCGWPWVMSEVISKLSYEGEDIDWYFKKCQKCFGP